MGFVCTANLGTVVKPTHLCWKKSRKSWLKSDWDSNVTPVSLQLPMYKVQLYEYKCNVTVFILSKDKPYLNDDSVL
uniref:Uncharacterized protein n=1 Tax=Anguilla anguilla TaxID=7936 RepID=A0A0E9QIM1_ANGAN